MAVIAEADTPARRSTLAGWSVAHPVGVCMLALALVVLGALATRNLGIDLLPRIIYPEIRVRVLDPGVNATVMEDRVTRYLEEQLAITEDAIAIQSRTTEGRSAVDLTFAWGTDIDRALRDASTRLDRARRFLPATVEPPVIFKSDPSQRPLLELVAASDTLDGVTLRELADYELSRWFLNLPGVAAVEVGGGREREIQVLPDPNRLAAHGLDVLDVERALTTGNVEVPAGRLELEGQQLTGRTLARAANAAELATLPVVSERAGTGTVRIGELGAVLDTHEDERLRVRLNGEPGVKISIQKQPQANTVAVADAVEERLAWLEAQRLIPATVNLKAVADQSVHVRQSIADARSAAVGGALLAMLVVWLFLGDVRRTLLVGSAIPIAILCTLLLMAASDLTLNLMTLGGLALGVGILVDATIVMIENIARHQRGGENGALAALHGANEVNGVLIASTSTNLASVVPFLFAGGLAGLLFRDLILTISVATFVSLLVALTLVPALGGRIPPRPRTAAGRAVDRAMEGLGTAYARIAQRVLHHRFLTLAVTVALLVPAVQHLAGDTGIFLPETDDGRIQLSVTADPGIDLGTMDALVQRIEGVILADPAVDTAVATIGGFIFGRAQFESPNQSGIAIQLAPRRQREESSAAWIARTERELAALGIAGARIHLRKEGLPGVRTGEGDDDLSLRIRGTDLDTLARLGEEAVERLRKIPGLRNVAHSQDRVQQDLSVVVDRDRAADLGLTAEDIGRALAITLQGKVVGTLLAGERAIDIRLRLPRNQIADAQAIDDVLLFGKDATPLRLSDVAAVRIEPGPAAIKHDRQNRIVEITASFEENASIPEVTQQARDALSTLELPPGHVLYDAGADKALKEGRRTGMLLVALALLLVFVVLAVQYESLRNPVVILLTAPCALIGAAFGLYVMALPVSMPVWLGLIMLAGIVVNNAIVLVEYIDAARRMGRTIDAAIVEAARLRLRPILMTTLTTVSGMLPLALALGEGAELLQPLAVTMVWGLGLALPVTLLVTPALYRLIHPREEGPCPAS